MPSTELRLVYIIDAAATWQTVGIVAEPATEHRRLDGSWDLPASLPSSAFELRGAAIEATLRRACDAGRVRVRSTPDERPTAPLRWDDGPPWQLRVHVARQETEHYTITAGLHRGTEEMPITEPVLLHWEGWLIARGTVARLDFGGAFAIAALFRNTTQLVVTREELSEFLNSFYALPSVPPIDLPHGSPVTEVHAPPIPWLKVIPRSDWDRKVRHLVTGFHYGPFHITGAEREPTLYDADTRTVHYRDFAVEAAARAQLSAHGVKQEWDHERGERSLVIPPHRLGVLVAEVIRAGWHVDAAGGAYRTAGPTRAVVRSGIDWFELEAGVQYGDIEVGLPELLEARRSGATSILLSDGTYGVLPSEWLARLGPLTAGGKAVGGVIRYRQSQVALLDALLDSVPEADVDATFERARAELRTFERVTPDDPGPEFVGTLREYQRDGLGWLDFLRRFSLGGCLADDMGLGKTVQVLAMLDARRALEDEKPLPSIVVVPRSLVFNWIREAERFSPRLRLLDYTGPARRSAAIDAAEVDLVITTYGTLRRDAAELAGIPFDYAILDEAQAIKNPTSASAKAARLLDARHRLAMTGTPIENRLEELWSLFEFLNPGMLGSASGFSELVRLTEMEDAGPTTPSAQRDLLARALRPVILRRTKEQVAQDLPPRTEQTLSVVLEGAQREFYDGLLASYRLSVLEHVDKFGIGRARMHILEALLRLRQAACHPGLADPRMSDAPSAKLDALLPRLEEIAEQGHKALVFSQFTSFLALARARLDAAAFLRIPRRQHARSPGARRPLSNRRRVSALSHQPQGRRARAEPHRGGLCLSARSVVEPRRQAQAIDRAHRIGLDAQRDCDASGGARHGRRKILELQASKRALADAILGQDHGVLTQMGRAELEVLLG
jgi:hypothetical protein